MPESIDVIIACYNEAETIENVILEHLKVLENSQTFDEYLITVIDDGSTDDSRAKINKIVNTIKNDFLIKKEIISAPIIVIITSIIATPINLCEWIPFLGSPNAFLYLHKLI